ncbi:MAG TPA: hypothetical protein V6C97_28335 [Oculatellaceae cyanobacterium]
MKKAVILFAASLAIGVFTTTAEAQTTTETTTVRTTTTAVELPSTSTYIVVDPATGLSRGIYDPVTRLWNGQAVPSGYYIVEQSSGRLMATADASGALVTLTTIPAVLPSHFVVIDGRMVYFESDYALRRAQLEARIDDQYAGGHLSNMQVKQLKQQISEITNLETKRKSNGTLKESTRREIERRFAQVQSQLDRDIAKISDKRVKIGIKAD